MNVNDANLSMDLRSLDQLKHSSSTDRRALKETAKQLESLFMQELMKSMRASTMDSGLLDNSATEMGTSMLDTQMASHMSGMPGGLSEMILKQLERQIGQQIEQQGLQSTGATGANAATSTPAAARTVTATGKASSSSEAFVQKHLAAAQSAEASSGIPAAHILGQAALESGWGKREIKMPDGSNSHNLFGIKAGPGWQGKVAEITTTEYSNGVAHKVTAKFRAYDSYEAAFKDHSRLLSQSPRYRDTVAKADTAQDFAQGLQRAGYATDPAYARKLTQVINTALRVQQATG
jgi:peptidoglycan hydrolase FlgJ